MHEKLSGLCKNSFLDLVTLYVHSTADARTTMRKKKNSAVVPKIPKFILKGEHATHQKTAAQSPRKFLREYIL